MNVRANMVRTLCAVIFALVPVCAHAQVYITEIMYAPKDTDEPHEWVELCNDSSDSIDISDWVFYEDETAHGLKLVAGTALLGKSECAIVADDAEVFVQDYVYTGTLFDSSWQSLSNTGEEIAVKISKDAPEYADSVQYMSSMGAKDNGMSLQRQDDGTFTEGVPIPGEHVFAQETNTTTNTTTIQTIQQYKYDFLSVEPPQDILVRVPEIVVTVTHAPTRFHAEVYNARGIEVSDADISWAFGDGSSARGREVTHTYTHVGMYTVSVHIEKGTLSDDAQTTVTVNDASVILHAHRSGDWVAIKNDANVQLDISSWCLRSLYSYFIFPKGTLIAASSTIYFDKSITRLAVVGQPEEVSLWYPDGTLVAKATLESDEQPEETQATATSTEQTSAPATLVLVSKTTSGADAASATLVGTQIPAIKPGFMVSPQPVAAATQTQPEATSTALTASVNDSTQPKQDSKIPYILALLAIVSVGVFGVSMRSIES